MKNKLKVQRAIHEITQSQLAAKAKVSLFTISAMEANKYSPSVKLALRIAKIFDVKVEDIFLMEDEDY